MDERMRGFLALIREVRHDVNGPLTSALGNVQLLLEDPAVVDPDVRETLRDIEAELRRLAILVRRLTEVHVEDADGAA